jgi:Rps23 Pro-64 3,4-dihydroxylase Tpa1-like proline 4-hydroxylase
MAVDKETIVKHEDRANNISAFAFGVGQKLEEMVKSRDSDLQKQTEMMQINILRFGQYLEQLGSSQVDVSELLEIYNKHFKIKC